MAQPQRGPQSHVEDFLEWLRKNQAYSRSDPDTEARRRAFVPICEAKKYLEADDGEKLEDILDELFPNDQQPDSKTLLDKYVAVFCILLKIGHGPAISILIRKELHDHKLLFDPTHQPEGFPQDATDTNFYHNFCEEQRVFHAPDFENQMDKEFDAKRILPIVDKKQIATGGSAFLYEIRIHPAYNKLLSDGYSFAVTNASDTLCNTFALKTYRTPEAAAYYESETDAFRKLKRAACPNLIGFYGNYRQGDSYNVILEFADKGSLEKYFRTVPPPREYEDIIEFWMGLFAVLKALTTIHNIELHSPKGESKALNGWHQDVKPANILVVSNGATSPYRYKFKLADLGLSHFTRTVRGARAGKAVDTHGTQTYGAPECFRIDDFWDKALLAVKQNVDIWSFGCVLSEAAVWMTKGWEGVSRYRQERSQATQHISPRLGDCFHDSQTVLPIVLEWHEKRIPKTLCLSDTVTPLILKIVTEDMLQEDNTGRLEAQQLWARFSRATKGTSLLNGQRPVASHLAQQPPDPSPSPPTQFATTPRGPVHNATASGDERYMGGGPNPDSQIPRASSPDRFNTITSDIYGASSSRTYAPALRPRPASQPQAPTHRPPAGPTSYSENQIHQSYEPAIREDDVFYEEDTAHPGLGSLRGTTGRGLNWNTAEAPNKRYSTNSTARATSPRDKTYEGGKNRQWTYDTTNRAGNSAVETNFQQPSGWPGHHGHQPGPYDHKPALAPSPPSSPPDPRNKSSPVALTRGSTFSEPEPRPVISPPPTAIPTKAPISFKRGDRNIPELSRIAALKWRASKKESERFSSIFKKKIKYELPGDYLLDKVGKRDHVFVIDDSISMLKYWDDMCELFSILAYIVKASDKDGIDMYFTMSEHRYNSKDTAKLVEEVEKRKAYLKGASNLNARLDYVLGDYDRDLRSEKALRNGGSSNAPKKDLKPLSVYVFTNVVWGGKSDPKVAIESIVDNLIDLRLPATQVGIQFISFGNDPECLRRLDYYDSELGLKMDIVDHTPSNGNLWKMILGAIDEDFDDDPDDSQTRWMTDQYS